MGKRVRESIVGIFIVVSVILFILLYTWLTGKIGFIGGRDVKVYFNDVGGLRPGDPVLVYGLEKGRIKSFKIEGDKVLVMLTVHKDILIPEDSRFELHSRGYFGSERYIKIIPGKGDRPGDLYYGYNETLDLQSIITELNRLIAVFESFKPADFTEIAEKISVALDKNIKNLSQLFKEPGDKLAVLVHRLDSLSSALQADGTVGKLLKSDEFYQELRETNRSVKELVEDIKANPKRYLEIKIF